jgi:predicted amidohydrolase YtcJ
MNVFTLRIFTYVSLVFFSSFFACTQKQKADKIFFNAKVYTLDSLFTTADAFAIKNGRFIAVGNQAVIFDDFEAEEVVNLRGKYVFPGFIDAHAHFFGLGKSVFEVQLYGVKSPEKMVQLVREHYQNHPDLIWLVGRGWDQTLFPNKAMPTNALLNAAFPDRPVFLTRVDGHAGLANDKALALAKIDANTKVEGGEILKDASGKPTGVLVDNAMNLVENVIPKASPVEIETYLLEAQRICFSYGITSVADAGVDKPVIDVIQRLFEEKKLKIGIYAMLSANHENITHYLRHAHVKADNLLVRSFKIYFDGALGSRGAKLFEPYSDKPESNGLLLISTDSLRSLAEEMYRNDYQVNVHCIGDSANYAALTIFGDILKGKNDKRWRIEHAQVVRKEDLSLFGKYNIVPSVQPTHAVSDMAWINERLGSERAKTAYAYKDLLRQNAWLPLGTDFPVESPDPFGTFHAATARKNDKNDPANGFQIENALTREEALRGMTIWAAKAQFEEDDKGSIETGKRADFIVLDTDLMQVSEQLIRNTLVLQTVVGGETVYVKPVR